MKEKVVLTANIKVNASVDKVWELWTTSKDIMEWNRASDDWETTKAENDFREGGQFLFVMSLKDDSDKFDFTGNYDIVITNEIITYTLNDGRKTIVEFKFENPVEIIETFEAVEALPLEIQKDFCQSVLNRFKKYVESAE